MKKKLIIFRFITGMLFALGFGVFSMLGEKGQIELSEGLISAISGLLLAGVLLCVFPYSRGKTVLKPMSRKLSKRTLLGMIMALFAAPLTIFVGVTFLKDQKYYFISLLLILETMVPFVISFESRRPKTRELVLLSVLCAVTIAGRMAFAALPQFKPVVALVIICGVCFGAETGFLVGTVTGFVSNFYFGQGPWTPWQMFALGVMGLLAGILFKKGLLPARRIVLSVFGFLATVVVYGFIMNFSSQIMIQGPLTPAAIWSVCMLGLPYDAIHGASTAFFLWLVALPLMEKLERVKVKYGLDA